MIKYAGISTLFEISTKSFSTLNKDRSQTGKSAGANPFKPTVIIEPISVDQIVYRVNLFMSNSGIINRKQLRRLKKIQKITMEHYSFHGYFDMVKTTFQYYLVISSFIKTLSCKEAITASPSCKPENCAACPLTKIWVVLTTLNITEVTLPLLVYTMETCAGAFKAVIVPVTVVVAVNGALDTKVLPASLPELVSAFTLIWTAPVA